MAPLRSLRLGCQKKASHACLYALAYLAPGRSGKGYSTLTDTKPGARLTPRTSGQSMEMASMTQASVPGVVALHDPCLSHPLSDSASESTWPGLGSATMKLRSYYLHTNGRMLLFGDFRTILRLMIYVSINLINIRCLEPKHSHFPIVIL